jgi:membrane fusion protein (multidrug efflux system)
LPLKQRNDENETPAGAVSSMKHKVAVWAVAGLLAAAAVAYFAPRWIAAARAPGEAAPAASVKSGRAAASAPAPVEVVAVRSSHVQEDLAAVGSLRSNESVMLRPEVAGRIARIGFRDGQLVRRGQLIVALDASVNQAEVAQARAEYDLARSNLQRTEDLASKNFVSPSARDQAASNVEVSAAKLKLAEARLSKMSIMAPFDGVVGIRNISVGDYVKDGTDLVNIEEIRTLKADFRVPERFFTQLRVGQKMEVTADALPNEVFAATLDAINPRVDAAGRSLESRAQLANPGMRLRPGMFVRVRLILDERSDALMVPEQAIVPSGSNFFVFLVTDGKARRVQVRTGMRREGWVEIVQGLSAGDQVVVSGQQRLGGEAQPVPVRVGKPAPADDAAAQ